MAQSQPSANAHHQNCKRTGFWYLVFTAINFAAWGILFYFTAFLSPTLLIAMTLLSAIIVFYPLYLNWQDPLFEFRHNRCILFGLSANIMLFYFVLYQIEIALAQVLASTLLMTLTNIIAILTVTLLVFVGTYAILSKPQSNPTIMYRPFTIEEHSFNSFREATQCRLNREDFMRKIESMFSTARTLSLKTYRSITLTKKGENMGYKYSNNRFKIIEIKYSNEETLSSFAEVPQANPPTRDEKLHNALKDLVFTDDVQEGAPTMQFTPLLVRYSM